MSPAVTATLRLVGKQHRYELALAVLASLAVGLGALYFSTRLSDLRIPSECLLWDMVEPGFEHCLALLKPVWPIYQEGGRILAAMAVLPGAVGLLGGVPIVARELEAGTAQFAWAIAPSRRAWLLRQLVVVGLLLSVAFGFAAVATEWLETAQRLLRPATPFDDLGLHGLLPFARMVAALMVGLALGALVGRTLPAFGIAAVVMLGLVVGVDVARQAWAAAQPTVVVRSSERESFRGEVVTGAWIDPSGALLSYGEAYSRVPDDHHELDSDTWLMNNGYEQVALGITESTARMWEPLEVAGWSMIGLAFLGWGLVLVDRRRPR
ncbi:MAG TPA: hypothetical protein VNJ28_00875 [Candidatus Limnocylindrales bacterium]|nr:hypothetical protein [Candidatus Limnocylindrales bacterium]